LKGKTRRCLRLTLVKKIEGKGKLDNITNTEEKNVREYVQMIKKAEPDFIHVKGFTSIGNARERMGYEKQPFHSEVKIYAKKILQELNKQEKSKNKKKYRVLAEEERSAVVVLGKDKKMMKIRKA
jgi:tRNA wybutosine-synthesizing protein 1